MMKELIVFPDKFYKAFDGTNQTEVNTVELTTFDDAMETPFDTDAHVACYSVPDLGKGIRVKKVALKALIDAGAEPQLNYVALDVDLDDHREWTDADRAAFASLYGATPLLQTAGIYFTKHGWRAIWELEDPVPARYADSYLEQFIKHARGLGIEADEACKDWTRLFRLPCVNRDGVDVEPEFCGYDTMEPLDWNPKGLKDCTFHAAPIPRDPDAPDPVDHPWVMDALDCIPPDCPYEEWLKVGIALKHEFQEDGLAVWDQWSRRATHKYDGYDTLLAKWATFDGTRRNKPVTIGSIAYYAKDGGFEMPQTEEELEATEELAKSLGVPVDQAGRYLVITPSTGGSYYIWDEELKGYSGSVKGELIATHLERRCPRISDGIHRDAKGHICSLKEILTRCGSVATKVVLKLGATRNTYDPKTQTMLEAVGAVDPTVKPEFNPEIDEWLTLLGGKEESRLKDWLACYLDFEKPICALYIDGPKSVGKGLLTAGISLGFHNTKATPYEALTGNFNEELTNCPLIIADESIPSGFFDNASSMIFRQILGTTETQINRKYRSPAVMRGAPRLLVTANGDDALKMREDLTQQDIDAITLRIGYIKVDNYNAVNYLESLGGRAYTDKWVKGKALARHITWLAKHRKVNKGSRFLVEGWKSDLVDNFSLKTGINGDVALALIDYLESEQQSDYMPYGNGIFYVHLKTFHSKWNELTGTKKDPPSQRKLSKALQQLSNGTKRPKIYDKQPTLYDIKIEDLIHVAKDLNKMTEEDLHDILNQPPKKALKVIK